jgi:hypothetical protein
VASVRGLLPAALATPLVLGLLLAGCGSSSGTPSGPTKAQYVAKADAICKAAGEKTAPLISKLEAGGAALLSASPAAARQLSTVVGGLHEDGSSALAQLRALKQPTGEKTAIESFLSPLSNVVSATGQAASSLGSGQGSAALGLLAEVQAEAQKATKAADAYGVQPCGSVVSAVG